MGDLTGRRIVLGVTGGIAAYKAVEVCRHLVDAGAHVAPILTKGALRFVGSATFDALASERVQTSLWNEEHPIPHTRLGQGADAIVVCPATARLLADYRSGRSGDLLTATLLATRARQINSYFGQLGEGLGSSIPPQVTSTARKPLSIAFEEISVDKIVAIEPPDEPEPSEEDLLAIEAAELAEEADHAPEEGA
ncbi:MAG: flavoprotein [Actinomycetota bacterium]|nr:flavoprotein [Actinomycetota bacterium]